MRNPLLLPLIILLSLVWTACSGIPLARTDLEAAVAQLAADPQRFEDKNVRVLGRVERLAEGRAFVLQDDRGDDTILVVLPTAKKALPEVGDTLVVAGTVRKLVIDNAEELRREFRLEIEDAVIRQHANAPLIVARTIKLRLEGGGGEIDLEDVDVRAINVDRIIDERARFVGQVTQVVAPRLVLLRDADVGRVLLVVLPANVTVQPGQFIIVLANVRDVKDVAEVEREVDIRIDRRLIEERRVVLVADDVRVRVRIEQREEREQDGERFREEREFREEERFREEDDDRDRRGGDDERRDGDGSGSGSGGSGSGGDRD